MVVDGAALALAPAQHNDIEALVAGVHKVSCVPELSCATRRCQLATQEEKAPSGRKVQQNVHASYNDTHTPAWVEVKVVLPLVEVVVVGLHRFNQLVNADLPIQMTSN